MIRMVASAVMLALALPVLAEEWPAQPEFDFMPDGGRWTLLKLGEASAIDLAEATSQAGSEAEWAERLARADPSLSAESLETLASYMAINFPLAEEVRAKAKSPSGWTGVLPPDGKDLAIANCQFCHSFFTGYLAHDRDTEGWRSVFKAPFHMELPMSAKERETFARYSAINMPIPYEEVPEDLRF